MTENELSEAIESEIKLKENVMKLQSIITLIGFENLNPFGSNKYNEANNFFSQIFNSYQVILFFSFI